MKTNLLSIFLLFISMNLFSQTRADKWFFGTTAFVDFTSGSPVVGMGPLSTSEGTSSVSTPTGSLMFYTNGVSVWDNTNTIMPNGNGLMGDVSSTQCLIVPSPASGSLYYIFTVAPDGGANGFRYSIVDMTLNGGLGDVTASKNVYITDSTTEKIAAILDDAGTGYWIIMHKWGNNMFYSYHLTAAGLAPPVASIIGTIHNTSAIQNTYGQMKFNMCGSKLAVAVGYQDFVEVFDFNQVTGDITNPLTIPMDGHVYGVEFSKSSDLLYISCYDVTCKLAQFDISLATTPLILASKTPLSVTDDLYALQIGPDGKIYVARSFTSSYLGVINAPNTPGSGCNYVDNGVDLDPTFSGVNGALGLPSFSQDFVKVNVICPPGTGIVEDKNELLISIFPNPSTNEFNLDLSKTIQPTQICIYSSTGQLIQSFSNINSNVQFGKNYDQGIYLVKCISQNKTYNQIVIKQ